MTATTSINTSSSSNSGAISSAGIGSGLDVTSIIAGLMKVESQPLTDLQTAATSIKTTISAFGAVQSAVSTFRDAVRTMALPSTWQATTGTSADSTAASIATTSSAAVGNYAVQVTALAASQSTVSGTFASGDALVGAGTLHIDTGSWNADNSAFTTGTTTTTTTDPTTGATSTSTTTKAGVDIAVTATDTLSTLAAKINAASPGINASVVTDASGSRLVFSSSTTGVGNGFRVTTADAALSGLAYDPANGTSGTTLTQAATNASATINGLAVTSATNTLSNVLSGITLTLGKVTTTPVQLSVGLDTTGITKSVQAFVDGYNALSSLLSTDLKYDSSTKIAGPLQANSAAVSLQRQLRNIIGGSTGASTMYTTLSQVGLEVQSDGTLSLNSTKLSSALANPAEVQKLFTNVDLANPANNGIANQLRTYTDSVLGSTGVLTTSVQGLNDKLTRNQTDQDNLNTRLAATQARLTAQYNALDTQMAGINTLGTYVTQQIANWNKST